MTLKQIDVKDASAVQLSNLLRAEGIMVAPDHAPLMKAGVTLEAPTILHGMNSFRPGVRYIGGYSFFRGGHLETIESVGRYCSSAPGLFIGGGNHPTSWLSSSPFQYEEAFSYYEEDRGDTPKRKPPEGLHKRAPVIGNDVWIGAAVTINRGTIVGDGAVIASGAVVVSDVPPYAIVGGVPAKVIRYRFDEETIKRLLAVRWWDLPHRSLLGLDFPNIGRCLDALEKIPRKPRPIKRVKIINNVMSVTKSADSSELAVL